MARKTMIKLTNPHMWYQDQGNGLVEAVIIENFGSGPLWYRLWVPSNKDSEKVRSAIVKRMASDYGIDLGRCSWVISNTSPLTAEMMRNKQ